jgi:hypothetical protein
MVMTGPRAVLSDHPFRWNGTGIRPSRHRFRGPRVSVDERPVALPKLYGAPAYARPPAPVALSARPFDPDQLPLQVYRTEEEERAIAAHLQARAYTNAIDLAGDPRPHAGGGPPGGLRPRLFNLRAIAGRLIGGD